MGMLFLLCNILKGVKIIAHKKANIEIKFEEALSELEKQVELLESGKLSLEDALEAFQKGTELRIVCVEKLNVTRAAVEKIVVVDEDSEEYEFETFDDLEEEDGF